MALNSKKILITGIRGQLGSTLYKYLSKFYNLLDDSLDEVKSLDITNRNSLEKIISIYSPDYVINCAAATNVDKCESNREWAYDVNVNGIKNIISSTRIRKCLQKGNIDLANKLLSRTWYIDGRVRKGKN